MIYRTPTDGIQAIVKRLAPSAAEEGVKIWAEPSERDIIVCGRTDAVYTQMTLCRFEAKHMFKCDEYGYVETAKARETCKLLARTVVDRLVGSGK